MILFHLSDSCIDSSITCGTFDVAAALVLYCFLLEITMGHDNAYDALFLLVHLSDSPRFIEAKELISSAPVFHSADLLISASITVHLAVLDIGI